MLESVGLGGGCGSGRGWMGAMPQDYAQYAPQIALARFKRVPFAPLLLNIQGVFSDPSVLIVNPQSFDSQNAITQPTIVDRMMFQIDAPNSYAGNQFKSLSDFFYGLQSPITATLQVTGAPRYAVAPNFTPIRALCAEVNEAWPAGWVLNHTQNIQMAFQASSPLVSTPTVVTVTFRLWQPLGTGEFIQMTDGEARRQLQEYLQPGATVPPIVTATSPSPQPPR
jgi:hypothetical protein